MTENEKEITPEQEAAYRADLRRQRWILAGIIVGTIVLLTATGFVIFALTRNASTTANIRDIFIIFMAFETLVIGAALVVLIIQIASLINLVQNEVRPILESTNETVNTLRGTTKFLSENLVEPVIKLNSYLAGMRRFFELLGIKRK